MGLYLCHLSVAWCSRGWLPCGLPAPYLCVSCFPASASNGRSWFSSLVVSSECFTTVEDSPLGRRKHEQSPQTPVQWSMCLKQILFSLQKCDLCNALSDPRPAELRYGICEGICGTPEWALRGCHWIYLVSVTTVAAPLDPLNLMFGSSYIYFSYGCCSVLNSFLQVFMFTWNFGI